VPWLTGRKPLRPKPERLHSSQIQRYAAASPRRCLVLPNLRHRLARSILKYRRVRIVFFRAPVSRARVTKGNKIRDLDRPHSCNRTISSSGVRARPTSSRSLEHDYVRSDPFPHAALPHDLAKHGDFDIHASRGAQNPTTQQHALQPGGERTEPKLTWKSECPMNSCRSCLQQLCFSADLCAP
jgi:hypothetical protein